MLIRDVKEKLPKYIFDGKIDPIALFYRGNRGPWALPGLGISWIIRFFWYSNNSVNYSSGRIEYRIPSRQSFLCRIVTDKCQIVTDEPNGNFFHFQYETVYCQAVAHCTALVSSLESRSSVKVDWGVQVPRLLLWRSNFCHYLIYLL